MPALFFRIVAPSAFMLFPVVVSAFRMMSSRTSALLRISAVRISPSSDGRTLSSSSEKLKGTCAASSAAVSVTLSVSGAASATATFSLPGKKFTSPNCVGMSNGWLGIGNAGISPATSVCRFTSIHNSARSSVGTSSSPLPAVVESIAARIATSRKCVSIGWTTCLYCISGSRVSVPGSDSSTYAFLSRRSMTSKCLSTSSGVTSAAIERVASRSRSAQFRACGASGSSR